MAKFAGMKQPKFIITGKSRLTGIREAISRPMEQDMAKSCLERINKKTLPTRAAELKGSSRHN